MARATRRHFQRNIRAPVREYDYTLYDLRDNSADVADVAVLTGIVSLGKLWG